MKHFIPLFLIFPLLCEAQGLTDVLRYGSENLQGSARYQAMSGAFGALGGEISSIHSNPAGSAFFNNSKIVLSGTGYIYNNATSYFGNEETTSDYNTELNQIGGVFVFKTGKKDARFKKLVIGFNYDRVNDFNNEILATGSAPNSIVQYFLNYANFPGKRLQDILAAPGETVAEAYANIGSDPSRGYAYQQAYLGYLSFIILPDDDSNPNNILYNSNVSFPSSGLINHRFSVLSEGANNKYTFNTAFQYTPYLYFGASFNFYDLEYNQLTLFDENGYAASSPIQEMFFDNWLRTNGNALSFSVGAVSKIRNARIGISYQSPIWWYRLQEELSQDIYSNLAFSDVGEVGYITNIFPEYKIQVPAKITGSAAYTFGKKGALSFDYSYQDFSKALLKPASDPGFAAENSSIKNRLGVVSTYRAGGEYRIAKFSVRGGYRWQSSAYKNNDIGELQGYSFGLGYNFGGTQLDASFNRYTSTEQNRFFDVGLLNSADIDTVNSNVTVSLTFNL